MADSYGPEQAEQPNPDALPLYIPQALLSDSTVGASQVDHQLHKPTPLRERMLSFGTLHWSLRAITLAAIAQAMVFGVLTGFRTAHLPLITVDTLNGYVVQLAVPFFVACFVAYVLAWSCLLTGALHSHWVARLTLLTIFTCLFTSGLVAGWGGGIQLLLLATLWVWPNVRSALLTMWPTYCKRPAVTDDQLAPVTFGISLAILLLYFALLYGYEPRLLPAAVSGQAAFIILLLMPAFFVAGTSFSEWGEVLAQQAAAGLARTRSPRVRALVIGVVATLILALAVAQLTQFAYAAQTMQGQRLVPILFRLLLILLLPGCVTLTAIVGIARFSHAERWSSASVPARAWYICATLLIALGVVLKSGDPHTVFLGRTGVFVLLVLAAILGGSGVALLLPTRARGGGIALTGLLLMLIGLMGGYLALESMTAWVFGLPHDAVGVTEQRFHFLTLPPDVLFLGFQAAVALLTLGLVSWFFIRRDVAAAVTSALIEPLTTLFVLNVGLQCLQWIAAIFTGLNTVTGRWAPTQGAVLVLSFLWDSLLSGKEVTNVDGKALRRYARVLLYFGYMMLVATVVVYYSLETYKGAVVTPFEYDTLLAYVGIYALGAPGLVLVSVLELSCWWANHHILLIPRPAQQEQPLAVPQATARRLPRERFTQWWSEAQTVMRDSKSYGTVAGIISAVPVALGALLIGTNQSAISLYTVASARSSCDAMGSAGQPGCSAALPGQATVNGIFSLFLVLSVLAFLATLVVYTAGGWFAGKSARSPQYATMRSAGAAIIATVLFTFANTIAASAGAQAMLLPLPLPSTLGVTEARLTEAAAIALFGLICLPIAVGSAVLAGWLGAKVSVLPQPVRQFRAARVTLEHMHPVESTRDFVGIIGRIRQLPSVVRYGVGCGIVAASVNLMPVLVGALLMVSGYASDNNAQFAWYISLGCLSFLPTLLIYGWAGAGTARATNRTGQGVVAALVAGSLGLVISVCANSLSAFAHIQLLVAATAASPSPNGGLADRVTAAVVIAIWTALWGLPTLGIAAGAGWIGAIMGYRAVPSVRR